METQRSVATEIAKLLSDAGHIAYFAGGCVRDKLIGKEPKDYDIATSATPDQVLEIFPKGDKIGAHFGVILVKQRGFHFEIATFRTDGSYQDGRRPESVTFSTPEEDAERRDFTVNGLFENPVTGEVIDYVNGQEDLNNNTLRAIGDASERFQEDGLRLMRAIRFAIVHQLDVEPSTWEAIQEQAHLLEKISVERIQEEFNKIIVHPQRRRGIEMLVESGLIKFFIPEVLDLIGCEQPPQFHPEGDVYVHTCIMLEMLEAGGSLELCLAVLFHDIGKPATYEFDEEAQRIRFSGHDKVGADMCEQILRRMRYSNQVIDDVTAMVANHMKFMHVQDMRSSKLKRFMNRETFQYELELHRVDCTSSNGMLDNHTFLKAKLKEFANQPLIPEPLIKGEDLIALGVEPSPIIGQLLKLVQTEQLEGRLTDKAAALTWVQERHRSK